MWSTDPCVDVLGFTRCAFPACTHVLGCLEAGSDGLSFTQHHSAYTDEICSSQLLWRSKKWTAYKAKVERQRKKQRWKFSRRHSSFSPWFFFPESSLFTSPFQYLNIQIVSTPSLSPQHLYHPLVPLSSEKRGKFMLTVPLLNAHLWSKVLLYGDFSIHTRIDLYSHPLPC